MNKKNEVDEFLGDLADNGSDDTFEQRKDDLFKDDNIEINQTGATGATGSDGKNEPLPFHKDPKIIRFIEKEVEKRTKSIGSQETPKSPEEKKEEDNELIDALTNLIGNDTPEKVHTLKMFKQALNNVEVKASEKAYERLNSERQAEIERDQQAENELVEGFDLIEDTFNVDITSKDPLARKLRGEFVEFIKRVAPKNSDGEVIEFPDFEETFKVFQESRKSAPQNNRKKDLASRSMNPSKEVVENKIPTDQSWKAVDKIINKLIG